MEWGTDLRFVVVGRRALVIGLCVTLGVTFLIFGTDASVRYGAQASAICCTRRRRPAYWQYATPSSAEGIARMATTVTAAATLPLLDTAAETNRLNSGAAEGDADAAGPVMALVTTRVGRPLSGTTTAAGGGKSRDAAAVTKRENIVANARVAG